MKGIINFKSVTVVLILVFSLILGGIPFTLNTNAQSDFSVASVLDAALVPASESAIPVWDPETAYHGGDLVRWNGKIWKAQWWTLGEEPGTTGEWGVWRLHDVEPTPSPEPTQSPEPSGVEQWDPNTVYVKGDLVHWNGYIWEAQWWTLGEEPGTTGEWGVWRQKGPYSPIDRVAAPQFSLPQGHYESAITVSISTSTEGTTIRYTLDGSEPNENSPIYVQPIYISDTTTLKAKAFKSGMEASVTVAATYFIGEDAPGGKEGFKVVGYFPSWSGNKLDRIQFDIVTHINYAFAIPTPDGSLLPLENPDLARTLIAQAHANNVKVLLAVGGWEYNGTPLENTFVQATNTDAKIQKFANAIMDMVREYGFDGVDMDWEHPRHGEPSQYQYEKLMLTLSNMCKSENKLLTSAVLSGVSPDGIIYWDSAAHTDAVLNAVDWINVMAYDGGDGERHSSYDFAVNCGLYWRDTRNMPPEKVVLGVPFYGRPSWASYDQILQANPEAYKTDTSMINGMLAHYNGIPTIKAKTSWAKQNVGGIMIWELSQDTSDRSKSLLSAIGEVAWQ